MQDHNDRPELNLKKASPVILIMAIGVGILLFGSSLTEKLQPGEAGLLFKQFSVPRIDTNKTYYAGRQFFLPWNEMIIYNVRKQEYEAQGMKVLSLNGLEINIDVSVWYQPRANKLGVLHQTLGPNYVDKFVKPTVRSAARAVFGRYNPEEIYSTKRESIQSEIVTETRRILDRKHITLDEVLIKSIILPPTIKTAIENKLKQEQEAKEYEFKLIKAQKEAEKQIIEAEGKAKANRIISASLTDKILKEKGIEATLELSNSKNSKVVVIGGSDGMPLILGNQ